MIRKAKLQSQKEKKKKKQKMPLISYKNNIWGMEFAVANE